MCDYDGEISESAVQASPVIPKKATAEAQTEAQQAKKSQISINNNNKPAPDLQQAASWQLDDVQQWMLEGTTERFSRSLLDCLHEEAIDGQVLLSLTEADVRDMRYKLGYKLTFGELKKFWLTVSQLQQKWQQEQHHHQLEPRCSLGATNNTNAEHLRQASCSTGGNMFMPPIAPTVEPCPCPPPLPECPSYVSDCEAFHKARQRFVAPEYFKTAISLGYSFVVTWITSFVMVIVHERVPDMKRYPPLPDIFLDNVPHIPWAFNMCEITGSLLFTIWFFVLIFHKYRMVLLRRFFALAGTVFLLRCVTMLITSLSVPGTHLQCSQKDFAIDDPNVDVFGALVIRMTRAYRIWSGLGMSIQGVRTCGDYMFSGHTVALTLLNFFITEYTPRNLYFLHTLTWLLNMFGIFFILAAHEHYSIDVFVAFYITSRLFLYYHTLSNNRALMQSDSTRTRIWFPMFSYFENHVDGIIPNEFDTPGSLIDSLVLQVIKIKDSILIIIERYWNDKTLNSTGKSSLHLFGTSESDLRNHSQPTSNFLGSLQSMGVQSTIRFQGTTATRSITPTPTPTPSSMASTPQQLKRTGTDVGVSPYASALVNDTRASSTEKKML